MNSIQLVYSFADLNSLNGIEWSNTVVFLKVNGDCDNIKKVVLKANITNEWLEFPVSKSRSYSKTLSIWQGIITSNSMLGKPPQDLEVCAFVETNDGNQVFDNNNFKNYIIPKGCGPLLFGDTTSFAYMEAINATIPMGNLIYCSKITDKKKLFIVYSFDKWDTVFEEEIPFEEKIMINMDNTIHVSNPTSNGTDLRKFQLKWKKNTKDIEYCIKLINTETSEETWDNNNSLNYKCSAQDMPSLSNLLNTENLNSVDDLSGLGDLGDFGLKELLKSINQDPVHGKSSKDGGEDEVTTADLFEALNSIKDIFSVMKGKE